MLRLMQDEAFKRRVKGWLRAVGYDPTHWAWNVMLMYRECTAWLERFGLADKDALDVSAGQYWRALGFKSFTEANSPRFGISKDVLGRQFEGVIADQVFEHLPWPYRAVRNVYAMVRPGGVFIVSKPFLIRVHAVPIDCSRWTETGLKHLLVECGFPIEHFKTGAWGNRACVKANFTRWARRGWFSSLRNEPLFPVTVWAFARKPAD